MKRKTGFFGSMVRDERGNVSAPRTMAFILVLTGILAFIVGIFLAAFGNKSGAAYCTTTYQFAFGGSTLKVIFAQLKSGYVSGQMEKTKQVAGKAPVQSVPDEVKQANAVQEALP